MNKEFENWAEEYGKTWEDSKAYKEFVKSNKGLGKELFAIYIQFKSQEKLAKWTIGLVIGTWVLAIATILLVMFK